MYEEFFKFAAAPFRLNPDPKFFFGSRSHNKAMAYLHYGLRQAEGFIVISGEIGAGKSMLIGHLIDQLDRSNVVAAHLLTTSLEPTALLSHILSAFRIEPSGTGKSAEIEAFEDFLFDQMNRGRRVLLIVDEAQNLPLRTMEELRMLSNMDYDGTPLFQVFMVGQPEFRQILAEPHMEQFRQRIIASYHLEPLGQGETTDYIRHRLSLVGWNNDPSITDEAFRAIFLATGGVPRKINKLCNRIFLYCSLEKLHAIDEAVVKAVVIDLKSENLERVTQKAEAAAKAPEAPKAAEASKPVEAPRAAKTANGATNGSGATKPMSAATAPTPRAPVVIPFGAVKKVSPAGESNGAKPEAEANPETKAEAKPVAEQKKPAPPDAPTVRVSEKPPESEKPAAKPEPQKMPAAEKPAAQTNAAPAKDVAPKPAESEEPKSRAAKERAMPKKTETPPAPAAKPAAAPAAAPAPGQMSVLDRLRAQRAGGAVAGPAPDAPAAKADPESERDSDRAPATLLDVAKAIEAVSAAGEAARKEAQAKIAEPVAEALAAEDSESSEEVVEPLGEPPISIDPKGWRLSIVKSINETRDELKSAHANVARLRKQLRVIDSRRHEKRLKIAANLARAESLLTEIRNAWR